MPVRASDAVVQVVFQRVYEGAYLDFLGGLQFDEGVEELAAEYTTLEQEVVVGFQGFQGFLISKPVSAREFIEFRDNIVRNGMRFTVGKS